MTAGERHPAFEPGNDVATRHGAYSASQIEAESERIHDRLLEVAPWCSDAKFIPTVNRYLRAAAVEVLAHRALESMDPGTRGYGRLVEAASAAIRTARLCAIDLGLTPASFAKLQSLVADAAHAEADLADLAAEGAEIRRRRDAEDARAVDVAVTASVAADEPLDAAEATIVDAGEDER